MTIQWTTGTFVDHEPGRALSGVSIELPALAIVAHWKRCGLTADWLAAFMAYDFERRASATSVLSTVVNELLENAVKFCAEKTAPVALSFRHYGSTVRIEVRNTVDSGRADALRAHFDRLESEDTDALFASLVANASEKGSPGLGLLILRRDYGASIGVRAETENGGTDARVVTVQVQLDVEEVEQR